MEHPFNYLQNQMNRLFNDFFGDFYMEPLSGETGEAVFVPTVDVSEDEKQIKVSAELPGMSKDHIELTLAKDSLTIQGEKKSEEEDKGKGYYRRECSYGSFQRVVPLPIEVDDEKAQAEFKNGVLKVVLPKTAAGKESRKKVEIKGG